MQLFENSGFLRQTGRLWFPDLATASKEAQHLQSSHRSRALLTEPDGGLCFPAAFPWSWQYWSLFGGKDEQKAPALLICLCLDGTVCPLGTPSYCAFSNPSKAFKARYEMPAPPLAWIEAMNPGLKPLGGGLMVLHLPPSALASCLPHLLLLLWYHHQ